MSDSHQILEELPRYPGTNLFFSTAFHLQTHRQLKWTIQMLEDMLRAVVMYQGGSWEDYLSLATTPE